MGAALVLAAYVAFTPPEVRGAGDCPSAAAVAARLAPLLPRGANGDEWGVAAGDDVEIVSVEGATTVKLRDTNGDVVHQRVVSAGACADRATEIAVLVAIWEADLHTEVTFPPPTADGEAASTPSAQKAASTSSPPVVARAPSIPTAPSELSLGAALSFVALPAGWIEATWTRGLPVRGRLALSAGGAHEIDLDPGTVTWRRVSLGLGAMADVGRGRARASVRAGALLAALLSSGSGFSFDQSATSWQLGADAGLRGGVALTPRLVVWADVGLAGFPGTQRVKVLNVVSQPAIPRWEAVAAVGASFSWAP